MSDAKPRKVPFQDLTSEQWWRLALVGMLITYILIFLFTMTLMGMFNYLGLDFRTFLASAQIAAEEGFSKVYDLEVQQKYQLPIYEAYRGTYENTPPYETVPTPYIPVYIVPFLIFLPFSPYTGFLLYTFISLAAFFVSTKRL